MELSVTCQPLPIRRPVVASGFARIAATGDLHVSAFGRPVRLDPLPDLRGQADLLVVAGDITDSGLLTELDAAVEYLSDARIPIVAVLGNHDLRTRRRVAFRRILTRGGIQLLDGESLVVTGDSGFRLGVVGTSGCGGGFWPEAGPERFPGRAMKALAIRSKRETERLESCLAGLRADGRLVLTHFSPTPTTLGREPLAKYWMLGNSELGRVIDRHAVDLAIHGHAHLGNEIGATHGGVPVRNVALPVTNAIRVFHVGPDGMADPEPEAVPVAEGAR